MAIPFKSLRYRSGPDQVWGIQMRRSVRRKNEWAYLTPVPQILAGPQAFNRISAGGTLVGLDLPPAGKNLELKPYAISRLTTDRVRTPPLRNDLTGDLGGDVKYGLTANLTADFTVNTDFAQVEIDEQQVNLTRFSLFFPEKRDFFLEGRGIFDFARGGVTGAGVLAGDQHEHPAVPVLQPAHRPQQEPRHPDRRRRAADRQGRQVRRRRHEHPDRRRVGLGDRADELHGGAREARHAAAEQHRRDVHQPLGVGCRSPARTRRTASTRAFSFFQNVGIGAYWARTETPGVSGDDDSYQALVDYGGDRYGAHLEYLKVGDNFNPEVGFVARTTSALLRHRCGSARGRQRSRPSASSPSRATSTTS